jgi:hypothetical protein
MSTTDRHKIKQYQRGTYRTISGITDPTGEVKKIHTRMLNIVRTGAENAATNVAEVSGGIVQRVSKLNALKFSSTAAVANDATNYNVLYVYKYTSAGASKTLLGSWNTATGAQGATVAFATNTITPVAAAAASIAAGSVITYHVGKFNAGQALANFAITLDLEEI